MRVQGVKRSLLRSAQVCRSMITGCWNAVRQKRQFEADFAKMRSLADRTDKRFLLEREHCYPCFGDATSSPSFGEYFFHLAWAARELQRINPQEHYDFSSHIFFPGIVSAFIPTVYHEFRHTEVGLDGFKTKRADLCSLPYEDSSLLSVSCMHVLEHIGLGRYGDPLDYDGDMKALFELKRVVARGGHLLLVLPVGVPARIEFNAHRIYDYKGMCDFMSDVFHLESATVFSHGAQGWGGEPVEDASTFVPPKYGIACWHYKRR